MTMEELLASTLDRLAAAEARIAELEKHSHPPIDLTASAYRAMAFVLKRAADAAEEAADEP